ncbi:MAG TPA: dTDP-4-dehydrorhamnose reductase [Pyrinomonadaceae bacterium]|nr:dTDP-4-dehydrorhamnose reductase [Pyrinomonadaceae bacterium]
MKVAVTGAGGLLGRAVKTHCAAHSDEVHAFDHRALDITNAAAVKSQLTALKPEVVFNCAAWTDVDGCESDPSRAESANALGPQLLASTCREIGALLITISTDYVFDGAKDGFYTQRDHPNPISVYGRFKFEGERRAQTAYARTIVVRSGYIFGAEGTNFLSTVLDRARRGARLKAISDMTGTPTYAPDLAARLRELAEFDLPGIYHVVNAGDGVSFETFARTALKLGGVDPGLLQSTTLAELERPAPRPRNSRLRCLLSEAIGLPPLRNWQAALEDFVTSQSGTDKPPTAAASPTG